MNPEVTLDYLLSQREGNILYFEYKSPPSFSFLKECILRGIQIIELNHKEWPHGAGVSTGSAFTGNGCGWGSELILEMEDDEDNSGCGSSAGAGYEGSSCPGRFLQIMLIESSFEMKDPYYIE